MDDNHSAPEEAPIIDARGFACPLPVLKLRRALAALRPGEMITLLATDRAAARDVPNFCQAAGHTLVEMNDVGGVLQFLVRRR